MNRTAYFFSLLLLALAGMMPAHADSLVQRADSAYTAEDYTLAADLYRQAIDSVGPSAALLYNLGNTEYRLGHPGQAVVAYERGLRINPADKDMRANLAFVNSRLIDRPGERGTLIGNMLDNTAMAMRSDAWAWIALGAFCLFLALAGLYMLGGSVRWRKVGFFGGFAVLAGCAVALFFAVRGAAMATATDRAVVTVPSTILSTSPREPRNRTEEAILLHEGTKMRILDSVSTNTDSVKQVWVDVQIDNEHRAWVNRKAIEII